MRFSFIITLFFLVQLPGFGQNETTPPKLEASPDYQLGPGDVIAINVLGVQEFDRGPGGLSVTVSNSGKIHLPFLGVLAVTDKSCGQLEQEIRTSLKTRGFVKDPQVQVSVVDFRAHTVYILGEIEQPGQYMLRGETYLTDLITWGWASSGGKSAHNTKKIGYFYRRRSPSQSKPESTKTSSTDHLESPIDQAVAIDLNQLFSGDHPELNFRLKGGDVLYVPQVRPEFFYVVGDIYRSGAVELPEGKQVTASQAIAQAGGPLRTAKMSKGLLIRYDEKGTRIELPTDFDAILKGKKPDFPVSPGDIVFIPGSEAKSLGYGLLNMLPTIATRAVY
jgi:polysaccharide export outer membrane protein